MENKNDIFENKLNKKVVMGISVIAIVLISLIAFSAYAFFNYTRTGSSNTLTTSAIIFNFTDGSALTINNQFPISTSDSSNYNNISFSITSHNTLSNGIRFNIYAVYGDDLSGSLRMDDSVVKLLFTPPSNGDGFSITSNNYATASTPVFSNGKCLIANGLVKNTSVSTTKNYNLALWIDDSKIFVSSTTKRLVLAEGNPSLADTTSGTATADRYIKNDNTLVSTTLYPASNDQSGKIVYTTNEFKNSFYSLKIAIEAVDAVGLSS